MRKIIALALLGTAMAASAPAYAAETITASFTQPDGAVTSGLYSGTVSVLVSGIGQSLGTQFNDAFYLLPSGNRDGSYYQLTFGTAPLVPFNPAQNAVNFLVGALPAYSPTNTYSFLLNTGTSTPSALHFGVGDGFFADNSGSYTITVASVPEPATWAMMFGGVGMAGGALRRRRAKVKTTVSFA